MSRHEHEPIFLEPGIYQPYVDMYMPHAHYMANEDDKLFKHEFFLVNKHDVEIVSVPYSYYSIKRLGASGHKLIKSYEVDRWNVAAQILKKVV